MTYILAISGKKQSGKNTIANFFLGLKMMELGITHSIEITKEGELYVGDIWGDTSYSGIFNYHNSTKAARYFIEEHINPFYKMYSFADLLKKNVCIDILGLSEESVYGTDEQKKAPTHLKWEDMPGIITEVTPENPITEEVAGRLGKYYEKVLSGIVYHQPGPMSGRDVMQYVGTEIFRKMYYPVWAKATINKIVQENTEIAFITDCRFPDEVESVHEAGGKVIRLNRQPYIDNHESEIALDNYQNFDAIIDNQNMKIGEQNGEVYDYLSSWNFPFMKLDGLK